MRKEPVDHVVKVAFTATEYLALKHLADMDERSLSGFIRFYLKQHMDIVSRAHAEGATPAAVLRGSVMRSGEGHE